jgi:hypothetical protein
MSAREVGVDRNENVLLEDTNKGGWTLAIIARFEDPYPVQYVIRLSPKSGARKNQLNT